jgi:hypothetical protein
MPNIVDKTAQGAKSFSGMLGEAISRDSAKVSKWIFEKGKISATSVGLISNETNKRGVVGPFDSQKRTDKYVWEKKQKAINTLVPKNVLDRLMLEKKQSISKDRSYRIDKINGQDKDDLKALNHLVARGEIVKRYDIQRQKKINTNQLTNTVHGYNVNQFAKGASTMGYKKLHAKATGVLMTAGVVSSLSNSRGQQTNAQLYGQDSIPGM